MKLADLEVMLTDAYKRGWTDRSERGWPLDKTGNLLPHPADPAPTPSEVTAQQITVRDLVFKHAALIDA